MLMKNRFSIFILLIGCVLDIFLWQMIFFGRSSAIPRDYFLDVGQGDSEMIIFPGNVKIVTDAGPDGSIVSSLGRVLPSDDHYIDLAVISHPQLDHFNGFNYLLDSYHFGAFLMNGRSDGEVKEWKALVQKINEKNIPIINIREGDKINFDSNYVAILSPNASYLQSAELNDTGIVEYVHTPFFSTLLTADTGFNIEDYLIKKYNFQADVLKVGHHGSKYSSSATFLETVRPKVAVIEVAAKNTYGHPSVDTLNRITSSTHAILLRTDKDGTIEVAPSEDGKTLEILTHR